MSLAKTGAAPRGGFYLGMALTGLAVVLLGFSRTYMAPMARGDFQAAAVVHLHGALAFGWVLLFVLQPGLIRAERYGVHMRTGLLGLGLAAATAATAVPVALLAVARDLASGFGPGAVSSLPGVLTSMAIFLGLVLAGGWAAARGHGGTHKRLMLLATIVVLWPAWFRLRHWLPGVPDPQFWLGVVAADFLMFAAMIRDRLVEGRVHPVWLWVGLPILVEQTLEAVFYDAPLWRSAATFLYEALSGQAVPVA
ncbi:hypothetical protein [Brevundimonas sp.]|uniref:hypothetical protein n=1 Tax=Brevundimonas sp. TaxID=1871086 RepID=UPI003D6C94DF